MQLRSDASNFGELRLPGVTLKSSASHDARGIVVHTAYPRVWGSLPYVGAQRHQIIQKSVQLPATGRNLFTPI